MNSYREAAREAEKFRVQVAAGRVAAVAPNVEGTTLSQLTDAFLDRVYPEGRAENRANVVSMLRRVRAFTVNHQGLGDWPVGRVSEDVLEAFFESLTLTASTRTKYAQTLRRVFTWARRKGYIAASPITDESTIQGEQGASRRRRLYPDEEARLLAVAPHQLHSLIIAALESLCRVGELLALQWRDVNLPQRTILIAAKERGARKTNKGRTVPVSNRLAGILEMRRAEASRRERFGPEAYVFGNEAGERVRSTKKRWQTCVLKAHGYMPQWVRTNGSNGLAPASRAQLQAIDLHFHDLRHEGGIRLLEKGWQLHHLQAMYGHSTLAQTARYLHADEGVLPAVMRQFEQQPATRGPIVVHHALQEPPGADASEQVTDANAIS